MNEFLNIYFDFDYRVGFAIGIIVFCFYILMANGRAKKRGLMISKVEIVYGLAFSVYLVMLLGCTLLNRTPGNVPEVRLELFWSHRWVYQFRDSVVAKQIVYNVFAFVPWGVLVPLCFERMQKMRNVVISAAMMSAWIELMQMLLQCGLCELDDVVHNSLGAWIGFVIWIWMKRLGREKYE